MRLFDEPELRVLAVGTDKEARFDVGKLLGRGEVLQKVGDREGVEHTADEDQRREMSLFMARLIVKTVDYVKQSEHFGGGQVPNRDLQSELTLKNFDGTRIDLLKVLEQPNGRVGQEQHVDVLAAVGWFLLY